MVNGKSHLGLRLGARIKARRLALSMKQDQLADRLGVEVNTVSRMECGTHLPSLTRLEQVAVALEVSVASLLGDATTNVHDQTELLNGALDGLTPRERGLVVEIANMQAEYFKKSAKQKKTK
jgi:transcriptional regulator with XRE-family HTH domain